jgi:hypothetical protein
VDENGEAALKALMAFIGAVVGFTGCLAGALKADAPFTAVAAAGAVVCATIWFRNLNIFELPT